MLDRISSPSLRLDDAVNLLRAAGENTRIRLLALLSACDLTVSDLIDILGQSQPRISRHLRLMGEAGLVERYQEGAWAFFRAVDQGAASELAAALIAHIDREDEQLQRDRERLNAVRQRRADRATNYFAKNAAAWDELRSLHADDARVEAAMLSIAGTRPFDAMLDLGTGTGRLLELFAPLYQRGAGVDASRDMLQVARANLDAAGLSRVQVRQGDLYMLPTPAGQYDFVTLHQVLHYLDDPLAAIREAARALSPGGRLLIADFAPHALEFLRDEHQHVRLGFSHEQMAEWIAQAGLELIEVRDIAPDVAADSANAGRDKLTVTLWLAQDPRLLIAKSQTGNQTGDVA